MAEREITKVSLLRRMRNQLIAACVLLFIMMSLSPPWSALADPENSREMKSIGYHFIGSPPQSPFGYKSYVIINYSRIIIQWLILFFAAILIYFGFNRRIRKLTEK